MSNWDTSALDQIQVVEGLPGEGLPPGIEDVEENGTLPGGILPAAQQDVAALRPPRSSSSSSVIPSDKNPTQL